MRPKRPLPSGNGRVGRLLIPLILSAWNVLPQPLLYLSEFFERHRDEYIDRLYAVSRSGDWIGWLDFFLRGVTEQCDDTIARVQTLRELHANYRDRLQTARVSALANKLVDSVFETPFLTIPRAQALLGVTYRAAQSHVEKLVIAGILEEHATATRPRWFVAREVFDLIRASSRG